MSLNHTGAIQMLWLSPVPPTAGVLPPCSSSSSSHAEESSLHMNLPQQPSSHKDHPEVAQAQSESIDYHSDQRHDIDN